MPPERKEICDCGVLERASKEPNHPIRWDESLKEYHIVWGRENNARMMIYYCPFCGGSTPEAQRTSLFSHITHEEERRILDLLTEIRTVAEALSRFGPPDSERESGVIMTHPESCENPGFTEVFRTLTYNNLSPVADIVFQVGLGDSVQWTWRRKRKGDEPPGRILTPAHQRPTKPNQ